MNSSTIEIHEFSTGIRPQKTADGGWVSLGFTGQYMNVTIDRIPEVVERSIANREFAVAEGASSDQPAIIGRVIGTEENTWSVLAVVTRGRDEKGRSASMYRYFLCQGAEGYQNLRLILAWWESQPLIPKFHPFDIKEIGKPNICDVSEITTKFRSPSPEAIAIPVNLPEPILLAPEQQYDLQTINTLALKKYNANKKAQALSWAFNVEALEKPERFLVIQAASDRAYQILQKAITNTPKISTPVVVTDEEALKSAIRGLMNSSQVKLENAKIIADALANDQITSEYWHTLFDGQGAKTAITQKIYSPQMVRLITLRAMVIPETVLDFLNWLNIKAIEKPDENQTISLEFQKAIRSYLPKDKLANSIKFLLPKLLKQPPQVTPEAIYWLLAGNGSAWIACRQTVIKDIQADIELIVDHFNTPPIKYTPPNEPYNCDPKTWEALIKDWRSIYSRSYSIKIEKYYSLAQLLEYLKQDDLAAYFYQVSQGIVPREVYKKISAEYDYNAELEFLGLTLKRESSFFESIIHFLLGGPKMPIKMYIITSILIFISGLFIGSAFLPQQPNTKEITQEKQEEPAEAPRETKKNISDLPKGDVPDETSPKSQPNTEPETKEKTIRTAIVAKNFSRTNNSINDIIKNIQKVRPGLKNDAIIIEIMGVLQAYDVNFRNLNNENEKRKLAEYIYEYQERELGKKAAVGFIGPDTKKSIEEKVKARVRI